MADFKHLLGEEWYNALEPTIKSDYWQTLSTAVSRERSIRRVIPEKGSDLLFKAFRTTPISRVKVVILGQDPYHDKGSYDGFAFSNSLQKKGRVSPSLQNILKEVHDDCYSEISFQEYISRNPELVSLERWAKQGVLLINTAHTVAEGVPGSHIELWNNFTYSVIKKLLRKRQPVVFILWGNKAKNRFYDVYDNTGMEERGNDPYVIESAHPSPYSASSGFFGSKPFSRANDFLIKNNMEPIVW